MAWVVWPFGINLHTTPTLNLVEGSCHVADDSLGAATP
jgi:hypothetical protein